MPRISRRAKVLKEYEALVERRLQLACLRFYTGMEDPLEDELDEVMMMEFERLLTSRYLFRRSYRSWDSQWKQMLYDEVYMTEEEFLAHFRMDRECIIQLNDMIKEDKIFSHVFGKMRKRSSMVHVIVLVKYLGSYGNEATLHKIGRMMGISKGSVLDYVSRACTAILKFCDQVIKWPNQEERKAMSTRIEAKHGFPNCVGLIDGTLFPLAFCPSVNGEDYFTRKGGYALHGLIICDDMARITWVEMGWPGSVHDQRAWGNTDVNVNHEKYFSTKEYLLGDSAFTASLLQLLFPHFSIASTGFRHFEANLHVSLMLRRKEKKMNEAMRANFFFTSTRTFKLISSNRNR